MNDRFFDSSSGPKPAPVDFERQAAINGAVRELADAIERHVPNGRNKSIALTSLEDVQMRANRGIFAPDPWK